MTQMDLLNAQPLPGPLGEQRADLVPFVLAQRCWLMPVPVKHRNRHRRPRLGPVVKGTLREPDQLQSRPLGAPGGHQLADQLVLLIDQLLVGLELGRLPVWSSAPSATPRLCMTDIAFPRASTALRSAAS